MRDRTKATWTTVLRLAMASGTLACAPLCAAPSKGTTAYQRGIELFQQQLYEDALENFYQALYNKPDDIQLNLWMGRTAYKAGNYEEALFAYQRTLVLDENNFVARVEKARTHRELGANDDARRELAFVIERCLEPKLLLECEHILKSLPTPSRHHLHGSVTVKYEYDSNASLGTLREIPDPFRDTVMIAPTGESDSVISVTGLATYKHDTNIDGLFLKAVGLSLYREHFHQNSLDLMMLKGSGGVDYVCLPWLFTAHLEKSYTWMRWDLNRNNWGFGGSLSRKFGDKFTLRLRGSHTERHHYSSSSGGNTHGHVNYGSLDGVYRFSPKHTLVIELASRYAKSPATEHTTSNFFQLKERATYLWKPWDRVTVDSTIYFRKDWYQEAHRTYTDRKRCDFAFSIKGGVSVNVWKCFVWVLDAEYLNNDSNIPSSKYNAKRVGTGMRGIF